MLIVCSMRLGPEDINFRSYECGLIKKYLTIFFFPFKLEGAWDRE